MSATRAGLMRAILDQPDDDEVRLIFADYLEDHGEADYGAFIRKQVALAGVPEYDPAYLRAWFHDRDSVTGRGMERSLPEIPSGLTWPLSPFRRGFAWWVGLRDDSEAALAHFARVADDLFAVAPVQGLQFKSRHGAPSPNLSALTDSPALGRLRAASFSLGQLQATEIRRLQDSPHATNLTELAFDYAGILPPAMPALFQPPLIERLTSLSLSHNDPGWWFFDEAIAKAGGPYRLRRLRLGKTSSARVGSVLCFDAPLLRTVSELDLSENPLGGGRALDDLADSQLAFNLASLDLSGTAPGVPGVRTLAESSAFSGLNSLSLRKNRLGPVAARRLSESVYLAGLHALDLSNNPIKDSGLAHLIEASFWPGLVQLEMQDCDIGEAGLRLLLEAPMPRGLVRLNLASDWDIRSKVDDGLRAQVRERFGPGTLV